MRASLIVSLFALSLPLLGSAGWGQQAPASENAQPAPAGSRFVFRALRFAHNTAELDPASYVVLKLVAERLNEVDQVRVRIEGHTDNTGGDSYNMQLSERRATHVKEALVALGVAEERMETVGRGSSQPIEPNATRKGRAINRRVEFVVIES